MIPPAELAAQIAATRAFIDADYEMITITPRDEKVSDGAGGWNIVPGVPLEPIKVRLIPQPDKAAVVSPEGTRPSPDYVILGEPGANFERYDTFTWKGRTWKIEEIHQKPEYERKGDVILHGG